mgnify:CR=1 FL=1
MLSLRQLLDLWGFEAHPFEAYTAENEPRLSEYFVAPPYFDDMVGSASAMTPAVVFGSRGIGKSAIRIHIENICSSDEVEAVVGGKALAITYDDFTRVVEKGLEKVSLEGHLDAIITKAVTAALFIIAYEVNTQGKVAVYSINDRFPILDLELLIRLVRRYFSSLEELQQERAFRGTYSFFEKETRSLSDRVNWFHNLWNTIRVHLIDVANIVQSFRGKDGIKPVDITSSTKSERVTTEQLMNDLYSISSIAEQLGYDGWYILIDKVDEDEHTNSDAESAASLIAPLIKNLRVLEIPKIGFKFFLWDQLRPILVEQNVRLDKIRNWPMGWTRDELKEIINRRLSVYSNNNVRDLYVISESELTDFYDLVIDHAMFSPREIIHVLDAIFREHARHSTQDTGILITRESVDRGLDEYCTRRVGDLYPLDIVRAITSLPARFTSNNVQTALRISKQAASARINKWADNGYIERIEDTRSEKDTSKMIYQYRVKEKRLERLIQRRIGSNRAE